MALDAQQQPLNGTRFRRISLGDDLANYLRAVLGAPGWTGEMGADLTALLVKQIGFGGFERPVIAVVFGIAGLDLNTVRKELEHQLRTLGRRHRGQVGIGGQATRADQNRRGNAASLVLHARPLRCAPQSPRRVASTAWGRWPTA